MKAARLIITMKCPRNCKGCCNTYSKIMEKNNFIHDVSELRGYDTIMITGGEPMLNPQRTIAIAKKIRSLFPSTNLYLYTAWFVPEIKELLNVVDGIQYTLHEGCSDADVEGFYEFQEMICGRSGSFRLYIDPEVFREHNVDVDESCWDRVSSDPWKSEDELMDLQGGLPPNEELFTLVG